MRELEAESWDNGARGRSKDGRSKYISPSPLFTEFLGGASNVELDIELKDETLDKFYVQVQLDEPKIGGSASDNVSVDSSNSSLNGGAAGGENIDAVAAAAAAEGQQNDKMLSIGVLTPYEESATEGTSMLATHTYHKQECDAGMEAITLFRIDNMDGDGGSVGSEDMDTPNTPTGTQAGHSNIAANNFSTGNRAVGEEALDGPKTSTAESPRNKLKQQKSITLSVDDEDSGTGIGNDGNGGRSQKLPPAPPFDGNRPTPPQSPLSNGRLLPSLFLEASRANTPRMGDGKSPFGVPVTSMPGKGQGPAGPGGSGGPGGTSGKTSKKVELPRLNSRQREEKEKFASSIRNQQKSNEDEVVASLVGMIKEAKDRGAPLDGVLGKWRQISRF